MTMKVYKKLMSNNSDYKKGNNNPKVFMDYLRKSNFVIIALTTIKSQIQKSNLSIILKQRNQ